MMQTDGRAVRGFLADADTGSGLGGLTVELWSVNGHGPELIAESQSDDSGYFGCAVPHDRFAARDFVDIELRVFDGGRQVLTDVWPLAAEGRNDPIELSVPREPHTIDALSTVLPVEPADEPA